MRLSAAGIELDAVSVGGLETCIQVPSWRLAFDLGRCPPSAARQRTVCFTHAHIDHMGGIATHLGLRDLWRMPPARYLVPGEYLEDVQALLALWRRLDRSELPAEIVPVAPGDVIELGRGRRVHVFRSFHRIPTVGYALERTRQKLRAELVGLPGEQIGAMRAAGEVITEEVCGIEVAFCGDTTAAVIDREPLVRRAKVLVLECTFLDEPGSHERALRSGHVDLGAIAERAELLEAVEAIVLTHFSARYHREQICGAIERTLPPELRARVQPLLSEPPWSHPRSDKVTA
ncbi:MAG TPA: hypothetical protein ENK18_19365 [Deltaproteobacteria bacterium]|nr:hypothetical protein [Deltaproteobacteria bacterium]